MKKLFDVDKNLDYLKLLMTICLGLSILTLVVFVFIAAMTISPVKGLIATLLMIILLFTREV